MEVEEEKKGRKIEYMATYVRLCKTISMWPRENISAFRYWLVFVSSMVSSGMVLLGMYVKIFLHASDIDGAAEVIDFATVFTSGLFRYWYAYFYGKRYSDLVRFMHDNFTHESFAGDRLTMDKFMRLSKFVCFGFMGLTQIWLVQMLSAPFINYAMEKDMRFENGTLVHPNATIGMALNIPLLTDSIHIGLSFFTHILGYHAMTYIYIFTDAFWFAVIILTTGQFEIIVHSLRNLNAASDAEVEEEADEERVKEIEGVIVRCVKQHLIARKVVERTAEMMHPIILIDFLHAVTSISFILLDATIALNDLDWIKLLNLLEYFFVSVCHMCILDYFGNELTLKEQEIAYAAYDVPWYKYSKNLKTHLLLMTALARNTRPLTGGKLYNISLEFFATTMRNIFSYFMVLLQLRETSNVET